MSVKNAIKVLISRFGLVFSILVFITMTGVVLVSLSMAFLPAMISQLKSQGLEQIFNTYFSLENISIKNIYDGVGEISNTIKNVFSSSTKFKINSSLFVGLILIFFLRFFVGYYELPVIDVLSAKMSSNARIGFFNRFISNLKLSTKYVLVKILYTLVFDVFLVLIMFLFWQLWGINTMLNLFMPFILLGVFTLLLALRFSLIALFSVASTEQKGKIFNAFFYSLKAFKDNFSSIYGSFLITWILIFALNGLIGLITFGVGLLLTIPASMAFLCALGLAQYYKINNRKFYTDETHNLSL